MTRLAHAPDEHVDLRLVGECERVLRGYLEGSRSGG